MQYTLIYTGEFKRNVKKCAKRGYDLAALQRVITILQNTGTLPKEYLPHKLSGNYKGYWECHVMPDWLLLWKQNDNELILTLYKTGTHSDIFGK
ncbi:MAG: type II toxin-antitoxin system YafQ family toxin [Bacteroidales bacterium]|nr:type II toxin-antitoxin system YafQ family toxin [Bacteroidales bacterium]